VGLAAGPNTLKLHLQIFSICASAGKRRVKASMQALAQQ
jgi:hypothetical protein